MFTPAPLPVALPLTALFPVLVSLPEISTPAPSTPLPLTVVLFSALLPLMFTPVPLPVALPLILPSVMLPLRLTPVPSTPLPLIRPLPHVYVDVP
ncbi:hypothetical protein, partial [Cronobacter turicensis]|uniref:hypothetical protein n=1 Tax=Cronobacter turicensis TaxID=413502 RepID=UPI0024C37047